MKIAIMQPYLFPYIGYFQLMNAVDEFVVYDNIKYTKKGWINRNRILLNDRDEVITFPLKHDSDYLDIRERYLADRWPEERKKMVNKIREAYKKAPYFSSVNPVVEQCLLFEETNLFRFILNSLTVLKEFMGVNTPLIISSGIPINHELKSEQKVIEICKVRQAHTYINPIGGLELYSKNNFKRAGLELTFLKTGNVYYKQFDNEFVPFLSIIDVLMFNALDEVKKHLKYSYELI